jgi:hypothetical protein
MMPHYANRLGKASDDSGLRLLRDLAVISELKIGASAQSGLDTRALICDVDRLSLLLTEQGEAPQRRGADGLRLRAGQPRPPEFSPDRVRQHCQAEASGVKLLISFTDVRPPINPDRLITR